MSVHGVDLECLLAYKELNFRFIKNCLDGVCENGFYLREKDGIVLIVNGEFFIVSPDELQNKYLHYLKTDSNLRVIVNFEGELFDIETKLSVIFNLENKLVIISISEKAIWANYPTFMKPSFDRFLCFGNICRNICEIDPPKYVFLGEESVTHEDFVINKLKNNSDFQPFNAQFFSEENIKEVFDEYVNSKEGES